jgi:membrane fusion protein
VDDNVPYLDPAPPHWAATGLAYIVVAVVALAALTSITVHIPATLSTDFVLTPCSGDLLAHQLETGAAFIDKADLAAEVTCAGEKLQAKLSVPEAGSGRLRPGQRVVLLYEAFPYGRYGPRYGTVRWLGTATANGAQRRIIHGFADIDDPIIVVDGQPRPLRAGMGGSAKIVLERRPLIDFALHPLHQFKESFAAPRGRTGREQRS